MAKETAATVDAWTKVQSTVEIEDLGNILTPLERMYHYYVKKSCDLFQEAATESNEPVTARFRNQDVTRESRRDNIRKNAEYYQRAAEAVLAVINQ